MKTRYLSLPLPQQWTPEPALAVWEVLTELADLIWVRYEDQIIDLIKPPPDDPYAHASPADLDQFDLFDPHNPLAF